MSCDLQPMKKHQQREHRFQQRRGQLLPEFGTMVPYPHQSHSLHNRLQLLWHHGRDRPDPILAIMIRG